MTIHQVNTASKEDFILLIDIFKDVFENDSVLPSKDYLYSLLDNSDFLVFVAKESNTVVGGVTIYLLNSYYEQSKMAYIYDLGVKQEFQGKGIGTQLINYVREYCQANSINGAFVQAETDDTKAIEFYQKTKPTNSISCMQFEYEI